MRSFERINYAIRPNKHIERRLIFSALRSLDPYLPISNYRYIGLGSMWFIDFVLAHKILGIQSLLSMEADREDALRANFNRPFHTVLVYEGTTSVVLPQINIQEREAIIWLDYDDPLNQSILSDLAQVCSDASNGSVLIATLNASAPRANSRTMQEQLLREVAGNLLPAILRPSFFDRVAHEYPNSLAQMLFAHLAACTRKSGRPERLVPLFNFFYADGAPMITVGAAMLGGAKREEFDKWYAAQKHEWVTGQTQFVIDAPHLTPREKLLFDQLLPQDDSGIGSALTKLELPFTVADVRRYARFYLYYPLFSEFLP